LPRNIHRNACAVQDPFSERVSSFEFCSDKRYAFAKTAGSGREFHRRVV
jgi:hypothetical protein